MPKETYSTERKNLLIHPGYDPNDVAALYLDKNHAVIVSPDNKSSISVNREFGIGLQGPLSILSGPDQIRFATMWKLNPLLLTCIPSTLYTPIPWLRQAPVKAPTELVKGIVAGLKIFQALV